MAPAAAALLPFGWETQTCRWHYENKKGLAGLVMIYVLAASCACGNSPGDLHQLQNFLRGDLINQQAFIMRVALPVFRENVQLTLRVLSAPPIPTSHSLMSISM